MFFACFLLYGCSRTFIASIMNGGLLPRTSKGNRLFQMMLQIHIIYNNKHEYCHVFIKRLVF